MIKTHFETAINGLKTEREKNIAIKREQIMREKILPYNTEIDASRDAAIKELTQKLSEDIAARQQQYATDKQAIITAAEQNKTNNQTAVLNTELAIYTQDYDIAIAELEKQAKKYSEE